MELVDRISQEISICRSRGFKGGIHCIDEVDNTTTSFCGLIMCQGSERDSHVFITFTNPFSV